MARIDWKHTKVDQWRDLWENNTNGKWIILDKHIPTDNYDKDKYDVSSSEIINRQTINGHFKSFKTENSALSLINKFLRDN